MTSCVTTRGSPASVSRARPDSTRTRFWLRTRSRSGIVRTLSAKTETRHPAGLYVCFFTEMWERFGYYLMVGILLLYLRDTTSHGGRGFNNSLSADIVGSYVALVYLTPFIGGLIADRYIGYRRAIF